MNISELESSFKKIDEIAKTDQILTDYSGDEEATSFLRIAADREVQGFERVFTESVADPGFESTGHPDFPESLISISLSDIEIEDYKQQKIEEFIARLEKKDGLEAVAGDRLPDVNVTYRTPEKIWVLLADYPYEAASAHRITAKKNFEFDLSSIPRIFWVVVASFELSLPAPLFHDLLYRSGGKLPMDQVDPYYHFSRKDTDLLFLELMERSGIPYWRRGLAYQAVRKFSGLAWRDNPDFILGD